MQYTALKGHRYLAVISIGFFKRALVNEGVVADKLNDVGLSSVSVKKTGAGQYEAIATWLGDDVTVDLPDEITHIEDLG